MQYCGLRFSVHLCHWIVRWAGAFFIVAYASLPQSWGSEGVRQLKEEEDKATSVSVDKAREMMEYEQYLLEKQDQQERLRGVSKTASWLKDLREGPSSKEKPKDEQSRLQKRFLKEKLKTPEENRQKMVKESTTDEEEKKKELEKKRNLTLPPALTLKSIEQEEEEKKKNRFYKIRVARGAEDREELFLKNKMMFIEEYRLSGEVSRKTTTEKILDNVPFLRELTLSPYAFESQDWER